MEDVNILIEINFEIVITAETSFPTNERQKISDEISFLT
jgi:hypothetical protein